MAIRFLKPYEVQDSEGRRFDEGEVVRDLSPSSEAHFISRGVAVAEKAKPGPKPKPKAE